MNREMFYREIGDIDDDLIQAANEACGRKPKKWILYRIAGLAACICLICGGVLWGFWRESIYINEISAPAILKVVVPSDENTKIVPVTWQELLAYYEMEQLPDKLGEDLVRAEQSQYVLYQGQEGNILYDTNKVYYDSANGNKTLSITLAKVRKTSLISQEKIRKSSIGGSAVLLAAASDDEGYTTYLAEFTCREVLVQVMAEGVKESEFTKAIQEIILSMK